VDSVGAQQMYLPVVAAEFQPRNVSETFMIRPSNNEETFPWLDRSGSPASYSSVP